MSAEMIATELAPPQINALYRLPDDFWPRLRSAPYKHDLFQLLRRIDARAANPTCWGARRCRVTRCCAGPEPSLSFAPSTLAQVAPRANSPLHDVSIFSFGLFGPNGPLPLHLTEYVRERVYHHQDTTLLAFTNLFHHRLTLLFYRAWADAQPTVSLDRPDNRRFDEYLSSLIGIGQPAQQERDSINAHAKHFMAGHLIRHSRDPEGLSKILQQYFKVPVRIVENVPHWLRVEPREQARLKAGRGAPRLGESAFSASRCAIFSTNSASSWGRCRSGTMTASCPAPTCAGSCATAPIPGHRVRLGSPSDPGEGTGARPPARRRATIGPEQLVGRRSAATRSRRPDLQP